MLTFLNFRSETTPASPISPSFEPAPPGSHSEHQFENSPQETDEGPSTNSGIQKRNKTSDDNEREPSNSSLNHQFENQSQDTDRKNTGEKKRSRSKHQFENSPDGGAKKRKK